jgi:V/A-type H+-transporting ATPase subunit I
MRAARVINSIKALSQVGWIMILWGMFFAAGTLVIGRTFPPFAGWLLAGGIPMALFFSNPERGILKGALGTLAQLPLSVIGAFSDIVSYLRLFAVGYATVVVAQSFNNMAIGGAHGILGGLAAALILFLGHTLNILLGFMAVIVHGIRLNMLEFSGHLDMQWSGKKYDPFRETESVSE